MCTNFPNIRITEGNNFSLILPLRSRTYVATRPIDEDIDPAQLENVVVTFGGVEYTAQRTEGGVQIDLPATLAVGTYDIILTAEYLGSEIRAAYESAVTIVPWSAQSTAEQYITGSPVALRAAYVLSGAMTDAELEALKQEYREKNAELDQAIAEYERRAAELDGVAQESTLTQGVQNIREDISHIDIDTSGLAKQGSNQDATLSAAQAAAEQAAQNTSALGAIATELASGKTAIVDAINSVGGEATEEQSLAGLAQDITALPVLGSQVSFQSGLARPINLAALFASDNYQIESIDDDETTTLSGSFPTYASKFIRFRKATILPQRVFWQNGTPEFYLDMVNSASIEMFGFAGAARVIFVPLLSSSIGEYAFYNLWNLIDLTCGANFSGNTSFSYARYNPLNAYNSAINNLCFPDDIDKYGRTFANNFEKWKWCIINHMAANLQDRTGLNAYTITFGSTVLSHFDAEMIAAFTDKNWTLA